MKNLLRLWMRLTRGSTPAENSPNAVFVIVLQVDNEDLGRKLTQRCLLIVVQVDNEDLGRKLT